MPLELARSPEMTRDAIARQLRNPAVADDSRRDHIRIVTGPQPFRHAYYASDEFFRFDTNAGIVQSVYGQRVLRVSANFIRALSKGLADRATERTDHVFYQLGRNWGAASMKEFAPRVEQEYEIDFSKLGMGMMLETWWWQMRAAGWGNWRYDFSHARNGLVFVDLFDSAVVAALGNVGTISCYLYSGLFAAAFSHLAHRDLACIELECAARGDSRCKFLVATPQRVDAAAGQRNAGERVEQIVERLTATSAA
jgi:predicted hydrocarbon binding protein